MIEKPTAEDAARNLAAEAEVERLRNAIRQHMNERGDDRCHADDGRLYAVLPEGDTRPERETLVTVENCQRFIECRQAGREYVSPQREIERLQARIKELEAVARALVSSCDDGNPDVYSVVRMARDAIEGGAK